MKDKDLSEIEIRAKKASRGQIVSSLSIRTDSDDVPALILHTYYVCLRIFHTSTGIPR
jgi:hypothetical protein